MLLKIQGGKTISGVHAVPGNKNAVLPMIAASLLTAEPVTLTNVPAISDVSTMLDAVRSFGTKVTRDMKAATVTLLTPKLKTAKISAELASKIRTSFLFAGSLLARAGRASLPPPGGDAIGHRRLDTHFAGFKALGAKAVAGRKTLRFKGELKGSRILLDEASVMATENILMASVLAKGKTVIYNAACEPHIVDLANMLNLMGAKITGAGTNLISIEGVETLTGCTARVGCDYIEAGSYVAAAAVTGGEILLTVPVASSDDYIESYRAKVYKGDELVGVYYSLSGQIFIPEPDRITIRINGLEAGHEYTVKVYAVNAYGKESKRPLETKIST